MGLAVCLTAWLAAAAHAETVVGAANVWQQVDHVHSIDPPSFPSPNPVTAFTIDKAQFVAYFGFGDPLYYALTISSPVGSVGPLAGFQEVFDSHTNTTDGAPEFTPATAEWTINYHSSTTLDDPPFHTPIFGSVTYLPDSFAFEDFDPDGTPDGGGTPAGGYSIQHYKVQLNIDDGVYHSINNDEVPFASLGLLGGLGKPLQPYLLFEATLYQDFNNLTGYFPTLTLDDWLGPGIGGDTSVTSWYTRPGAFATISVVPVPLPAAAWMALPLFGGLGVVGAVRRRRQAA